MRKVKLTVEYDGTDFAGFQTQAAGIRTVQETLDQAIEKITGKRTIIHAAGRTDSGVHAFGQVVHFATESDLSPDRIGRGLNGVLPRDVSVRDARDVGPEFHARFSATQRTYLYSILNRPERSAVLDRYTLHERDPLDRDRMRTAAREFCGSRDFSAFANAGGEPGSTMVRRLDRLSVRTRLGGELIVVVVSANAFLRSMVRNIVGALIDVGRGNLSPADIERILETCDRTRNPCATAAARGLCLYKVSYEAAGIACDAEGALPNDQEG